MVKVSGPMMSFDASGTLAKTATFSKWKGRNYVRNRVIPANPKSGLQVGMRAMFKFLSQNWSSLTAPDKATWQTLADAIVASPFNAYVRANQLRWRNFTSPSKATPITAAGSISTYTSAPAATGGVASVTIDWEVNVQNDGWGFLLFRDLTTGFTPSLSNCIAAIYSLPANPQTYVDSPLVADEYFYDTRQFTDDGVLGALEGEISATAT